MIGISVAPEAQGQGVGTALMQAMCDYADRWMGVLRIELTVYVDNARGDRPLSQVRLRDRRAVSRLCDARRPLGRCIRDGADPSGAAGDRRASPARPARPAGAWPSRVALAGAAGFAAPAPRSGSRSRASTAPATRRSCSPAFPSGRASPAPAVALFHGCGGAFDAARSARRMRDYAALFNGAGLHVLVVDSLTPRYENELCTQRIGKRRVTQANRRLDALGAIAYLAERADVDAEADRPGRLVERRQHGARGDQPAPSRRRRGDGEAGLRRRLLSRLRSRPEARLRTGGAAADAGRPARRLDAGRAVRRAGARRRRAAAGDRGLCRRVSRLRQRCAGASRKDVPNGVNPGQGVHVGGNAAAWRASRAASSASSPSAERGAARRRQRARRPEHREPALPGRSSGAARAKPASSSSAANPSTVYLHEFSVWMRSPAAKRRSPPGQATSSASRASRCISMRERPRRRTRRGATAAARSRCRSRRLRWRSALRLNAAVTPSASS